jgi:hypothetical protein
MQTYRIVRFYNHLVPHKKIIKTGLTLYQAQVYCQNEDSHGEDWFDGYERED